MNSLFTEQILADKLSKLNCTQQCIETLSHWCIFHREKAEVVVATWDKQFRNSEMTQKVPLLYLANDILQNSKRKGDEFVTEFWKVLPAALKDVVGGGDVYGNNVISRLVKIWEERRVFGSHTQSLKDIMLGDQPPQQLELSKKRRHPVKIVKRDSRSIRTKLAVGGSAEKIVSAFHLVLGEHATEDAEMTKCKSAVHRVRKMERDVDIACSQVKDPKRSTLARELEEEENTLKQCIEKLKLVEANRVVLVTQLRDALHDQESELEDVRTQMQVAQAQIEESSNMRKRLTDENHITPLNPVSDDTTQKSKRTAADIAAEVADRLAASSSSQLIMTSVLSTFAAEEAKNAGLTTTKLEQPMPAADPKAFKAAAQPPPAPPSNPYQTILVAQPTMQSPSPSPHSQYQLLPNTPSQQYMQTSGVTSAYGYGNGYGNGFVNGYSNLPSLPPLPPGPPPPLPPQAQSSVMPSVQQQLQVPQHMSMPQQVPPFTPQQSMLLIQQPPAAPSFRPLQPHGVLYYPNPHSSQ